MKYCIKCGKELHEESLFCSFCGTKQPKIEEVEISENEMKELNNNHKQRQSSLNLENENLIIETNKKNDKMKKESNDDIDLSDFDDMFLDLYEEAQLDANFKKNKKHKENKFKAKKENDFFKNSENTESKDKNEIDNISSNSKEIVDTVEESSLIENIIDSEILNKSEDEIIIENNEKQEELIIENFENVSNIKENETVSKIEDTKNNENQEILQKDEIIMTVDEYKPIMELETIKSEDIDNVLIINEESVEKQTEEKNNSKKDSVSIIMDSIKRKKRDSDNKTPVLQADIIIEDEGEADEIADEKKIEDEKKLKKRRLKEDKLDDDDFEGRKGKRKTARRSSVSKIYDIEQEQSHLKIDKDPNYDGYYENVLPADNGKLSKHSSFDKKTILAAIGLFLFLSCVIIFSVKYFFL